MKCCKACKVIKPLSEFYKNPSCKDGLQTNCIPCYLAKYKNRYHASRPFYKSQVFFKRYGITKEQQLKMFEEQGHKCAICFRPINLEDRRTHQDHCHTSGNIRGILCLHCNMGLGHFKESLKILRSAQKYLKKYSQETE